ncbi:MAG: SPFH domain-containing protein [Proteobacteria bacterium]|nr:SPFH domain-containing protein [Pseudomonadota bacterium]
MDQSVISIMKEKGKQVKNMTRVIVAIVVVLIVFFIVNPFIMVGPGERGVVLNFGAVQSDVFSEGLHLRIPGVQKVVKLDVRVQKSQTGAESVSKDLQDTHSTIAVNYHILPEKANWVYQNLGREYKD